MGWVVNAKTRPIYPREWPGTHNTGGWVGPLGPSERVGRSALPLLGFDPRTVQPIASRYTNCSIPAPFIQVLFEMYFDSVVST